jgi:TldD protein
MQRRDFLQIGAALAAVPVIGCGPDKPSPSVPAAPSSSAPPAPSASTSAIVEPPAIVPAKIVYFERFGVDVAMIRAALSAALSRGGDHADVFFQHKVSRNVALEDGAVNRAWTGVELGVGVRVVKGDQTGYAFTEELTVEAITRAAKVAAAIADGPAREAPASFRADPPKPPKRYGLARGWEDVRADELLPILTALDAQARKADARVKKVTVSINHEHGAILIADADGRLIEDLMPMTSLGLGCVAEQNGRRESNGYNVAGRNGLDFYSEDRLARVVREAVARTTVLFEATAAPAGEMPIVMAAGSSGILLHEAIGHGMEADFNRKNTSIFADKIGKPVAKPFVNIVDDGSVEHARGAIDVDDEGNVAGKTMLVENGTLATYLHDSISAKHYKTKPTGNGRRESYKFPPMPRMRATYMLPGPHEKDEILASVKKGIYCTNFANGQVKIGAGDFTFYVKNGFLIEDGKITRPIKDVNIIGNGPKVLEKIDMVGKDLLLDEGGWTCGKDGQSVPVSQGLPTTRVSSITVGGTSAGKGGKS